MTPGDIDRAEPSTIARPLQHCPSCNSTLLDAVVETRVQEVHFLCRECSRCWDVALGAVTRVAPLNCFGCPERRRCEEAYAADHAPRAPAVTK